MIFHSFLTAKHEKEVDLVNMEGPNLDTPLHTASAAGHLTLTKLLVERGANIDSTNWNNATPLLHACSNDRSEVAKFLIERCTLMERKHFRYAT